MEKSKEVAIIEVCRMFTQHRNTLSNSDKSTDQKDYEYQKLIETRKQRVYKILKANII